MIIQVIWENNSTDNFFCVQFFFTKVKNNLVIEQMFINFAVNNRSLNFMSRFITTRKVSGIPVIKGFKPFGLKQKVVDNGSVNLLLEEYEAIRLCDYEQLNHFDASVRMGVSRPTFTRIYASALNKLAIAMVEGRSVYIEGGKVCFDSDWYHCESCKSIFNHPDRQVAVKCCPLCGSLHFHACTDKINDRVQADDETLHCLKCDSDDNNN
jgi:uncharacterized protein